ncbi:MAG TPA: hypothetical protein VGS19_36260 [Streptosporangiaceae bacterium]|nr:hypothetical protein [Streptosporangiaceae bacterium]
MSPLADLALGTGNFPAVVVDAEVVAGVALLDAVLAGMVATSVMMLGPSSAQVSVTWARYPVQRVTWPRRE